MIRVYIDKIPFEEIVVDDEKHSILYNILMYHSDTCINMSDEEFEKDDFVLEILNSRSGRGLISYETPFVNFIDDPVSLVNESQSLYILDRTQEEALNLSVKYGITVVGSDLDDSMLRFHYGRGLSKGSICERSGLVGWQELLQRALPPFNCLVISDDFLFENENGQRGEVNIIQFIQAILPLKLSTDFHLLVIAPENDIMNTSKCAHLCGKIKTAINNIGLDYNIILELVFSQTLHKRIACSNTFSLVMDKGFAVFNSTDLKTVISKNEIHIKGHFVKSRPEQGDTEFKLACVDLKEIAKTCLSTREYIRNRKEDKNKRIFGDTKKDKTIVNRLLREYF